MPDVGTPLFLVTEYCVAGPSPYGRREYKAGHVMTTEDLASWAMAPADEERQVAELLTRNKLDRVPSAPAEPAPEPAPFVVEPAPEPALVDEHPV